MNMYWVSVIRLHFYKIHSKDICKYAYLSDPPDMFTRRVCKSSEIQAPISSSHIHGLVWSVLWTTFHNTHKGICSIGALEQEYKMHSVWCVRRELFAQVLDNKSDTSSPASCYSWGSAKSDKKLFNKIYGGGSGLSIQLGLIHILHMYSCHRLRGWMEAWSSSATSSRISTPWNCLRLTMSFSALQCNSLLRICLQFAMSYIVVVELPFKVFHCSWIIPAPQYPLMFASLNCLLLYLTLYWSYACMSFNAATGCKIICFEL